MSTAVLYAVLVLNAQINIPQALVLALFVLVVVAAVRHLFVARSAGPGAQRRRDGAALGAVLFGAHLDESRFNFFRASISMAHAFRRAGGVGAVA